MRMRTPSRSSRDPSHGCRIRTPGGAAGADVLSYGDKRHEQHRDGRVADDMPHQGGPARLKPLRPRQRRSCPRCSASATSSTCSAAGPLRSSSRAPGCAQYRARNSCAQAWPSWACWSQNFGTVLGVEDVHHHQLDAAAREPSRRRGDGRGRPGCPVQRHQDPPDPRRRVCVPRRARARPACPTAAPPAATTAAGPRRPPAHRKPCRDRRSSRITRRSASMSLTAAGKLSRPDLATGQQRDRRRGPGDGRDADTAARSSSTARTSVPSPAAISAMAASFAATARKHAAPLTSCGAWPARRASSGRQPISRSGPA